jgi:thioredoxin reductase (NADPH)
MTSTEIVIVGGGPAGLSAAIYLARYRRKVVVFDRGDSRARLIPRTRNLPGFPEGISGPDLLERMAQQAKLYGAEIIAAEVTRIDASGGDWLIEAGGMETTARAVLFATGVRNRRPAVITEETERSAIAAGRLRYCPVCDGLEAGGARHDAKIGVIGAQTHGVAEALFLATFSPNVTLFTQESCELHEKDRADLQAAGIAWNPHPIAACSFEHDGVVLELEGGAVARVDTLYPALGSDPNIGVLAQLKLRTDPDGCILTDHHQRLGLEGLYSAGDVVAALDQIAVAMGHGAVAATTIHNDLRRRDGETVST